MPDEVVTVCAGSLLRNGRRGGHYTAGPTPHCLQVTRPSCYGQVNDTQVVEGLASPGHLCCHPRSYAGSLPSRNGFLVDIFCGLHRHQFRPFRKRAVLAGTLSILQHLHTNTHSHRTGLVLARRAHIIVVVVLEGTVKGALGLLVASQFLVAPASSAFSFSLPLPCPTVASSSMELISPNSRYSLCHK